MMCKERSWEMENHFWFLGTLSLAGAQPNDAAQCKTGPYPEKKVLCYVQHPRIKTEYWERAGVGGNVSYVAE